MISSDHATLSNMVHSVNFLFLFLYSPNDVKNMKVDDDGEFVPLYSSFTHI